MKKSISKASLAGGFAIFALSALMVGAGEGNQQWAGYQDWFKVTQKAPNTGDPTGFLTNKHSGIKAYREIYINQVGESVNKGRGPFVYPEGTVVVKEAYKNKKAWEAKKKPVLTIMIKLAKDAAPKTGDWEYVMGASGKKRGSGDSKWGKFCGSCHINAANKDYVFMNQEFIESQEN